MAEGSASKIECAPIGEMSKRSKANRLAAQIEKFRVLPLEVQRRRNFMLKAIKTIVRKFEKHNRSSTGLESCRNHLVIPSERFVRSIAADPEYASCQTQ